MRLKLLQKVQLIKTVEPTGNMIGKKITNRTTKVSKNSQ